MQLTRTTSLFLLSSIMGIIFYGLFIIKAYMISLIFRHEQLFCHFSERKRHQTNKFVCHAFYVRNRHASSMPGRQEKSCRLWQKSGLLS
jgi:hypothetical protein